MHANQTPSWSLLTKSSGTVLYKSFKCRRNIHDLYLYLLNVDLLTMFAQHYVYPIHHDETNSVVAMGRSFSQKKKFRVKLSLENVITLHVSCSAVFVGFQGILLDTKQTVVSRIKKLFAA